jgi:hypothetical protein
MGLADELLLLAYSDDGTAAVSRYALDLGLGGAVLLELALAERFDVRDGRIAVADPSPTGDPVLDDALARVGADRKGRKPRDWVKKLSRNLRERLLDDLVAAGVLTREKDRVLGLFPRTRYPSAHGVVAPAESSARQRLAAALDGPDPVPTRTAALAALVQAVGLAGRVFPGRPAREVKDRIAAMSEAALASDRWASDGVRKAIEEVEAGIMVAIVAGTTAATTAGTNS